MLDHTIKWSGGLHRGWTEKVWGFCFRFCFNFFLSSSSFLNHQLRNPNGQWRRQWRQHSILLQVQQASSGVVWVGSVQESWRSGWTRHFCSVLEEPDWISWYTKVARKFLAVVASSSMVECLFSSAGHVYGDRRGSLNESSLITQVTVYQWLLEGFEPVPADQEDSWKGQGKGQGKGKGKAWGEERRERERNRGNSKLIELVVTFAWGFLFHHSLSTCF